jgi:hypothetical protein
MCVLYVNACLYRTERRRSTLTRMSLGDITALKDISDTKGVGTPATAAAAAGIVHEYISI